MTSAARSTPEHLAEPLDEVGRPGDGFLAGHSRRAALSAAQQGTGENPMVERHNGATSAAATVWQTRIVGGDWHKYALCRQVDPELFFPIAERGPGTRRQVAAAKAVCARCPVQPECLDWALDALPAGIAGGATTSERRRLRKTQATGNSRRRVEPPPGANRAERAACGRDALAAGEDPQSVAERLGVTRRTVDRWAATASTTASGGDRAAMSVGGTR